MGLYSLPCSRFLGCHATLRGAGGGGGNVAWHSKNGLRGRLLGFSGFFFRRLSGCLCSPLPRYRVVNVSPLLSYALSNNPRIVYCTQPVDTHVNNIISLIMHRTVYLLPVFSFAKILQLIVEIWAYLTDFWGSYALADNWLICWLHAQCMIPMRNVSPKQSNKENKYWYYKFINVKRVRLQEIWLQQDTVR